MSLSVIGVGFGRTGTMSLKLAIERLGLGPCHHMDEIFANPPQLPNWMAAASGQTVDWDDIFSGYNSSVDWPGAYFWRELADHFPESKLILTTRPTDGWWKSYSSTIMKFWNDVLPNITDDHVKGVGQLGIKVIAERTFGGLADQASITKAYDEHNQAVISAFSADRLLQFDVRDGWRPLCEFLGQPEPDEDFPRSNSSEEFWQMLKPRDE